MKNEIGYFLNLSPHPPYKKNLSPSTLLYLLTSNLERTSTALGIQDIAEFLSLFTLKSVYQVL